MKFQTIGATAALAVMAAASQAAVTWDGGNGDGLWGIPANWNPDGVPTGSYDVIIGLGAAVTGANPCFFQSGDRGECDCHARPAHRFDHPDAVQGAE